jgi:hypothetical protein
MDTIHISILETASLEETDCPAMWKVLVCRLGMAERRQRISDDWEMFAFGVRTHPPRRSIARH